MLRRAKKVKALRKYVLIAFILVSKNKFQERTEQSAQLLVIKQKFWVIYNQQVVTNII